MKFTIIYENTKKDDKFNCGHGLSLYIEKDGKKILLDTGCDDTYLENAKMLGIDISDIDIIVLSHFHYDHTGGLKAFLSENKKAVCYIGKEAFADYYVGKEGEMKYFGMDKNYDISRFVFIDEPLQITENISLISKLGYTYDNPLNDRFYKKTENGEFIKDDFSHEVAIVIKEGDKNVLVSGCFHSGVVNSTNTAINMGYNISHIIGGFHLKGLQEMPEGEKYFETLSEHLKKTSIISFTGHCTSEYYLERLLQNNDIEVYPMYTGASYSV